MDGEPDIVSRIIPIAVRVAQRHQAKNFKLNVGDPILYGKYKNKKGLIKGFKTGPKGDPIVIVEQVPNDSGRKQDKELKLFKIRYDKERARSMKKKAAIFEAPPGLIKAFLAWAIPKYASNALVHVERRYQSMVNRAALIEAALAEIEKLKRTWKRQVEALDVGEKVLWTVPWLLNDGTVGTYAVGILRGEEGYFFDHSPKRVMFRRRGYPSPLENLDYQMLRILERSETQLGIRLREVQRSEGTDDATLVETGRLLKELKKYTSKAKAYRTSASVKIPITAASLQGWKYLSAMPSKPEIEDLLKAEGWDKFKGVFYFNPHSTRGGVWNVGKKELQIDVPVLEGHLVPETLGEFQEGLQKIAGATRHEFQHVGQSLFQTLTGAEELRGLPPGEMRDPTKTPLGLPKKDLAFSFRDPHAVQDVEFYTDLADEIDAFVKAARRIPEDQLRDFFGVWTETRRGNLSDFGVRYREYFSTLKIYNKAKWKKAIAEFLKGINARGIYIPKTGKRAFDGYAYHTGQTVMVGPSDGKFEPATVVGNPADRQSRDEHVMVAFEDGSVEELDPDNLQAEDEWVRNHSENEFGKIAVRVAARYDWDNSSIGDWEYLVQGEKDEGLAKVQEWGLDGAQYKVKECGDGPQVVLVGGEISDLDWMVSQHNEDLFYRHPKDSEGEWRPLYQHYKSALAHRIAAKYQKKKKIKTQDGDEATVYEYSDRQVSHRNREKAKKVEKLRQGMDKLESQVRKDLTAKDEKTRLTALGVALINRTFERVGNPESAKEGHFGVTVWQAKHVKFEGGNAVMRYVGKSGVKHKKILKDKTVVKALKAAMKGKKGTDAVFSLGDQEEKSVIAASDVNDYLKQFSITAKDIRGLRANQEMQDRLKAIRKEGPKMPDDKKEREKLLKDEFDRALEGAAEAVGHEAATLRTQYLVPGLEDDYLKDGKVQETLNKKGSLDRIAIIHIDNATDGDGSLRGLPGLISSLTLYEQAIIQDMLIHDAELKKEMSGDWTIRGHKVEPDAVTELMGAGYLEDTAGVVSLSSMFQTKMRLYTASSQGDIFEGLQVAFEALMQPIKDVVEGRTPPLEIVNATGTVPKRAKTAAYDIQGHCPLCQCILHDGPRYHNHCDDCGYDVAFQKGEERFPGKDWTPIPEEDPRYVKYLAEQAAQLAYINRMFQGPGKVATRTPAEKEDDDIEDLRKKNPKLKPPRYDLRKRRVDVEDDDLDQGAEADRDLTKNYKRIAQRWLAGDGDVSNQRIAFRFLLSENPKAPTSAKDLIVVRNKETGKPVRVTPENFQDNSNLYEEIKEGEPEEGEPEDSPEGAAPEGEKKEKPSPEDEEAAAEKKKDEEKDEEKAKKKEISEAKEQVTELMDIGISEAPKVFKNVNKALKTLDPKDTEKLALFTRDASRDAIGDMAGEANFSDEVVQEAQDSLTKPFDAKALEVKDPEVRAKAIQDLAKRLVQVQIAQKVILNPKWGGGSKITNQKETKSSLRERANASFDQYSKLDDSGLNDVAERLDRDIEKVAADPKRKNEHEQLKAVKRGLNLARITKGQEIEGRYGEPAPKELTALAGYLHEKKDADPKTLLPVMDDWGDPDNTRVIEEALRELPSKDLRDMAGGDDGVYAETLAVVDSPNIDPEVREMLLSEARRGISRQMGAEGQALAEMEAAKVGEKWEGMSPEERGQTILESKRKLGQIKSTYARKVARAARKNDEAKVRKLQAEAAEAEVGAMAEMAFERMGEVPESLRKLLSQLVSEGVMTTDRMTEILQAAKGKSSKKASYGGPLSKKNQSSVYKTHESGGGLYCASPTCGDSKPGAVSGFPDLNRRHEPMSKLTKRGALQVTDTLDRMATLFQQDFEILGVDREAATDFYKRCEMLGDHIERHAGIDPLKKATMHFPPDDIGREEAGPLVDEPDEPFMKGEFDQQEFRELSDRQEAGDLGMTPVEDPRAPQPGRQLAAEMDAVLADIEKVAAVGIMSDKEAEDYVRQLTDLERQVAEQAAEIAAIAGELMKKKDDLKKEQVTMAKEFGKKLPESLKGQGKAIFDLRNVLISYTKVASVKGPKMAIFENESLVRIGEQFSEEVREAVADIFEAVKKENSKPIAAALKSLKYEVKNANLKMASDKEAGIMDLLTTVTSFFSRLYKGMVSLFGLASKTISRRRDKVLKSWGSFQKEFDKAEREMAKAAADENQDEEADEDDDKEGCDKKATFDHGFNLTAE